jgi:mannosyltransferase
VKTEIKRGVNTQPQRQLFGAPYLYTVGLLLVVSAAVVLRLLFLDQDSLWWDELASVVFSGADWQAFWKWELQSESLNLVLYYLILRFWLFLGESEFAVRSLSVIFGVFTVTVVFSLGKRLFDARTGLIAALILSVHVFHIEFSQEARGYSLLTLLVTLSCFFFVKSIERPSWGNWAGYALTSVLAGYSHFFGSLVLVAHASSLIFLSPRAVPWKKLIISWCSTGLMLVPLVYYALLRSAAKDPTVSETSLDQFVMAFTGNGGYPLLAVYLIPVLVVTIFAIKSWLSSWATLVSWRYGFLLTWLLLPILLALAASAIEPVFVAKYLLGCLPALVILAAAGISCIRLPGRVRFPVLSGAILISLLALSTQATLAYYTNHEKEDWRSAANLVASRWEPGDSFLIYKPAANYFGHYLEQLGTQDSEMRPAVGSEWRGFIRSGPDREEIARFLPDEPQRIWLVLVHDDESTTGEIQAALESKYRSEETHEFYKVGVILYDDPKPGVFGGQWSEARRVSAKEEWRELTYLVVSQWQPGDAVLFQARAVESRFKKHLPEFNTEESDISFVTAQQDLAEFIDSEGVPDWEALAEVLPDHFNRIWLVLSNADIEDIRTTSSEIHAALRSKYPTSQIRQSRRVTVALYSEGSQPSLPRFGFFPVPPADDSIDLTIEDFDYVSDLMLNGRESTHLEIMPVPGMVGQALRVDFSGDGWWSVTKSLEREDLSRYQGISLAVKGNSQVGLQLREGNNGDGSAGEYWSVSLPVTEDWRSVSYHWSDFERDGYGPDGNGSLDVDSIRSVRVRQGTTKSGYFVTDEWRLIEGPWLPWPVILGSSSAVALTGSMAFAWWLSHRSRKEPNPATALEAPRSACRAKAKL